MSANKQVLELIRELKKFYKNNIGDIYPDADGKCRLWDSHLEDILKVVENPEKYFRIYRHLNTISEWYLKYSQFARAHLNDKALQKENYTKSAWCGYQTVKVRGEFNRFRRPDYFFSGKILLYWSNCLLAGWFDEAIEVGERCLKTAEEGGGVMGDGYSFDTASFFLLELHCIWQGIDFDRETFDHPLYDGEDTPFIYRDILKNWNTADLGLVNDYVSRMADYHLTQTREEEDPDEDYYEFNNSYNQLYPYEIMAWLKLREHLDIPNPAEFGHPLMNQPLAEFIEGTPLERPDIEQVNDMLAIVRNALPEANI